ncbi:mRNA export factor GLE1-like isoform X2 [Rhincodon typus]|uniref:mRNA export factor GLE1-like isoform X2 n=1 Tax=Rhincodon typus TaxID=259920 RepID=UPI00202EA221|nr:mRNA export factor GLE1-like isoform X2 [Rhincodon typus]
MPAEEKRWETLEALRNSEKGRLQYDSRWLEEGEDLVQQCRSSPTLSVSSAWVLDHLFQPDTETNTSEHLTPLIYGLTNDDQLQELSVPPPDPRTNEETANNTVQEVVQELTPEHTLLLLSPEATQIEGYVKKFEEAHRIKSHAEMKHRQELHQKSVQSYSNTAAELLKRFEESLELEQRQEYEKMRDMMEKGSLEAQGRQEKLKEEHRRRAKVQSNET